MNIIFLRGCKRQSITLGDQHTGIASTLMNDEFILRAFEMCKMHHNVEVWSYGTQNYNMIVRPTGATSLILRDVPYTTNIDNLDIDQIDVIFLRRDFGTHEVQLLQQKKLANTLKCYYSAIRARDQVPAKPMGSLLDVVFVDHPQALKKCQELDTKGVVYRHTAGPIWHPVRTKSYKSHDTVRGLPKVYDICFVANGNSLKGHDFFIKHVCDNSILRKMRIALVGFFVDAVKQQLQSYINQHCLNIHFIGYVEQSIVNFYLNISKVGVVCSGCRSGFDRITLEMMAAGTPVLARDNGAKDISLFNQDTGILSKDQQFGDNLAYMIAHYKQYQPYQYFATHWSPQKSAQYLLDMFQECRSSL